MMSRVTSALAGVVLLCGSGFPVFAQSAEEKIRAAGAAWEKAYAAGDVEELIQHYTDDAASMPPGFPAAVGKAAIKESLGAFLADYDVTHETEVHEIVIDNDLAFERADYTQSATPKSGDGEALNERGKHIVVYQRDSDGSWRVKAEIWNSNQ